MNIKKLIEKLEDIEGITRDAYSCCPEGDIGTDTSDTMYYIDHASDELEKLLIKLRKEKQVFPDWNDTSS